MGVYAPRHPLLGQFCRLAVINEQPECEIAFHTGALATQAMSLALVAGVCVALIGMLNVVGTVGLRWRPSRGKVLVTRTLSTGACFTSFAGADPGFDEGGFG